jgi:hypothetical protein
MRRSVAAVLTVSGVAVAVAFALALWVRLAAPREASLPPLSGQRATRSYDFTAFTGIETSGEWQVTLERGDVWAVELSYPIELERFIEVRKDGADLVIGYQADRSWWSDFGSNERFAVSARVVMPALEEVDVSGAIRLTMSGFAGRELEIDASGAIFIEGTNGRYDELDLAMSGAGRADLRGITTTNARIAIAGAQNIVLRMAGGSLSGDISGASEVEYLGTISAQDVDTSGFASLRHRE